MGALEAGFDIKQSEVMMAPPRGSVVSHLRFGREVHSLLFTAGTADILLSFEPLEALRYINWLKPEGILIYNTVQVNPPRWPRGPAKYPERIAEAHAHVLGINARAIATQAGTARATNLVLLGALSPRLPFTDTSGTRCCVGKLASPILEVNSMAFQLGKEVGGHGLEAPGGGRVLVADCCGRAPPCGGAAHVRFAEAACEGFRLLGRGVLARQVLRRPWKSALKYNR